MTSFVITFLFFAFIILIMSVGVLFGRKPVQGSCGGLNKIDGMGECEICGGDRNKCDESQPVKES